MRCLRSAGVAGAGVVALIRQRDDERRGNSPPREGLQLCVAPYFATRGRGDMRGRRGGVPPKSHPGGVRGCRIRHGVYRGVYQWCSSWLLGAMTACHRLRGGIFVVAWAVPACHRHPGRRNTGLRTAATPAGVAKMSAFGHRAMLRIAGGGGGGAALAARVARRAMLRIAGRVLRCLGSALSNL